MADANELVKLMKKAAVEAVAARKPVNVFFGKVQSVRPLKIGVEQRMQLGEAQLVLTRNVTDFDIMATVEWDTEKGKKKIRFHNGLCIGDEVVLIRQQEGQKFIVADRIGGGA